MRTLLVILGIAIVWFMTISLAIQALESFEQQSKNILNLR